VGGGGEGADLLAPRPFTRRTGRAHARLQILLADIQRGAPLVQQFHQIPPDTTTSNQARPSGGTTGPEESGPRAYATIDSSCQRLPTPYGPPELARHHRHVGVPDGCEAIFPPRRRPAQRPGLLTRKLGDRSG